MHERVGELAAAAAMNLQDMHAIVACEADKDGRGDRLYDTERVAALRQVAEKACEHNQHPGDGGEREGEAAGGMPAPRVDVLPLPPLSEYLGAVERRRSSSVSPGVG